MDKPYEEMTVTELESELEEAKVHLNHTGRALSRAKDALDDAEAAVDQCEHEAALARKDLGKITEALEVAKSRDGYIPRAEAEAGLADLCSAPSVVIGAAGPQAVPHG